MSARTTDPDTSHQAAARNPALRITDRARALLAHADHADGVTDFELAALIDRKQTSAGKRRHELGVAGLVVKTDHRRPSDTGSPAIVWQITNLGQQAAYLLRIATGEAA